MHFFLLTVNKFSPRETRITLLIKLIDICMNVTV